MVVSPPRSRREGAAERARIGMHVRGMTREALKKLPSRRSFLLSSAAGALAARSGRMRRMRRRRRRRRSSRTKKSHLLYMTCPHVSLAAHGESFQASLGVSLVFVRFLVSFLHRSTKLESINICLYAFSYSLFNVSMYSYQGMYSFVYPSKSALPSTGQGGRGPKSQRHMCTSHV